MKQLPFLAALLSVATFARADEPIFLNSKEYDNGDFGPYPIQHFKATGHRAPRVNLVRQSDQCDHNLYTFFSPRGFANNARLAQSTILDQNGHLVWTTSWGNNQQMYNLQVQQYKGNKYLTFWAGNDAVGGHGAGKYYMLDQSYKKFKEINAANGLKGDLHEFTITEQGTAIITAYKVVDVDLSSLGKTIGPIWECLFQEIDIETGDLVFEWRASEHIAVADTYRPIGGEGNPHGAAFDWFHINSIDKDPLGNYIVSSRYLHSVTYIDGRTGDVIWVLGGKKNMFEDLSDGHATSFGFQHDARWANNYTEITIFDNSDDGGFSDKSHPRGVRIKIDQEAMTAELVQEYKNPTRLAAASQGSMRDLPNGNVLLGFGNAPLFTEFSHDGEVLCETHFGPAKKFGSGEAQSYRVLKFAWQGFPTSDPAVAIKQDEADEWRVYVSWNGATEIVQWVLQGADTAEGQEKEEEEWQMLEAVPKDGFETSFLVKPSHPAWLRALAVDGSGNVLGVTPVANATKALVTYLGELETLDDQGESTSHVPEGSEDDSQADLPEEPEHLGDDSSSQEPASEVAGGNDDPKDEGHEEIAPPVEEHQDAVPEEASNPEQEAPSDDAAKSPPQSEEHDLAGANEDHTWLWIAGMVIAGGVTVAIIYLSPARRAILGRRRELDYEQIADQEPMQSISR